MIICGTGHRPHKLGGYSDKVADAVMRVAFDWLEANRDVTQVISGGALGWDQALARAARLRGIPYAMYLPFEHFDSKWPERSRQALDILCGEADVVRYVAPPGYNPYKMQQRNEAMVDDADLVLALWDGTSGGTANCIRYAKKVGKPINNLWENYSHGKQAARNTAGELYGFRNLI